MISLKSIYRLCVPALVIEFIHMLTIRLAIFMVASSCNKANQIIFVKANWANEVCGLTVCSIVTEPKNHIALSGLKEFVSALFNLECILPLQFLTKHPKCIAYLKVHHVCRCQFGSKRIQQLSSFTFVRCGVRGKQLFDCSRRCSSLTSETNGTCSQSKGCGYSCDVHVSKPFLFIHVMRVLHAAAKISNRHKLSAERRT